ncbi:MAG: hypothetical protein F4Z82_02860 [Caldilineaceae bacterium SB0668_bin_21]|nr:hypothetical protein [Caldilineaceae bacterium SB0668_bin_21]MXX24376.1 hypothetical protein [Caldilineaceae bacterium SB0668_bin_21]
MAGYIGGLTIGQGRYYGQPFPLLHWQRRLLRCFDAPGDAAVSLGRGGGKSTFIAGIAAAAVDVGGPLVEPGAQTVVVASSFDQGKEAIFDTMMWFLRPTLERYGRGTRGRFRVQDSANRAVIEDRETRASVRVLGCDPRRGHGLQTKLVIADEIAQWEPGSMRKLLAALDTSGGKLEGSKMLWLGTRPETPGHPFQQALDGLNTTFQLTYAARAADPPFQRRTWKRANPGLDYLPDLEAKIRSEVAAAKHDPDAMAKFRAHRLNQGVGDTAESWLVDPERWADALALATPEASGPYVLGIDLGDEAAMTAAAGYWSNGRLDAFAAFPAIPTLAERGKRDGVEGAYLAMAERGELVCHPGRTSKPRLLVTEALLRWGQPVAVVADAHRKGELLDALEGSGMTAVPVVIRRMGPFDGGEDRADFHRAILEGLARPTDNRLLDSAVSEARTVLSPKGGMRHLAKGTAGGRRLRARDDAAAAAVLAVAAGWREWHSKPATTARLLVGSVG